MFKRAIPKPTQAEQDRQDRARACGCIACRIEICVQPLSTEIHHQTQSGRQISQRHTVALCSWHHRAICVPGMTRTEMEREYGPSLHRPRKFFERYGDNAEQLQFQDELIGYEPLELPRRNVA